MDVTDLDPEQNIKPESSCQDDDALMAENEVKLAGRASSHSPDPESLASLPPSLSESAEEPATASSSETESSVDSIDGAAECQPPYDPPPGCLMYEALSQEIT